jgi:hypothetical protein
MGMFLIDILEGRWPPDEQTTCRIGPPFGHPLTSWLFGQMLGTRVAKLQT